MIENELKQGVLFEYKDETNDNHLEISYEFLVKQFIVNHNWDLLGVVKFENARRKVNKLIRKYNLKAI